MKITNDKNCDSMDGDLEDETSAIGCGDDTDYGYYCHLPDNDELDQCTLVYGCSPLIVKPYRVRTYDEAGGPRLL